MKRKHKIKFKDMPDVDFIAEARRRNAQSIRNTGTGEWLEEALIRMSGFRAFSMDCKHKPMGNSCKPEMCIRWKIKQEGGV